MKHFWEQGVGKYIDRHLWAPMCVWFEDFVLGRRWILWAENIAIVVCLENCKNLAKFQTLKKS